MTKRLKTKLNKYASLSSTDKVRFCKAAFLLPIIECLIRIKGIKPTCRLLSQIPGKTILLTTGEVRNYGRLINSASQFSPINARCLARTLYLWRELGSSEDMHICIGMNKLNNGLHAHAWLEKDGVLLNDLEESVEFENAVRLTVANSVVSEAA